MCLCQNIQEIQREAAGLSTGDLRAAIHASIGILETAVGHLSHVCSLPGVAADTQFDAARDLVFASALITALYVRELTYRPAEQPAQVGFSVN